MHTKYRFQVTPFIDPKTNRTFQAKLYENGQMEFQYLAMDLPDPYNQVRAATIYHTDPALCFSLTNEDG
jgi:hypothetical protein